MGLAVALLALAGAGSVSASRPPVLRLVSRQPLVVRGAHFKALEPVTLTVLAVPRQVARVRSSRTGSFRVTFDRRIVSHCGGFGIRASGAKGSVAVLRIPLFACSAE